MQSGSSPQDLESPLRLPNIPDQVITTQSSEDFESSVAKLRSHYEEEIRFHNDELHQFNRRLIRESYEKRHLEMAFELEAQKMQLVAYEERISSLLERTKPLDDFVSHCLIFVVGSHARWGSQSHQHLTTVLCVVSLKQRFVVLVSCWFIS